MRSVQAPGKVTTGVRQLFFPALIIEAHNAELGQLISQVDSFCSSETSEVLTRVGEAESFRFN